MDGFEFGACFTLAKQVLCHLEPHFQSIFALVILEMGFLKLFVQIGLEL
jgi:hypothetical protein